MGVYLDNGATTPLCREAQDAMLSVMNSDYGNPSGMYSAGVRAKSIVNKARSVISKSIGAYDREVIFTSGGTESDNSAIRGVASGHGRGHIISTAIEHHAVLNTLSYLERNGFDVTLVSPDEKGVVSADSVISKVRPDTFLISMMLVNNETGAIQPVSEVGSFAKANGIVMHTDAVAAYGKIPVDVNELNVDLMSVSAHKFNGPKGTGFLYVRRGTLMDPFIFGGGQEWGVRGGTENTIGIAGMGAAAEYSLAKQETFLKRTGELKRLLFKLVKERISDVYMNGDEGSCAPWCLNLGIPGINGSSLIIMLDMKGISASTGATCAQSQKAPSHVLRAMGRSDAEAAGSLRFTISDLNTEEEMLYTADRLKESVDYLRSIKSC